MQRQVSVPKPKKPRKQKVGRVGVYARFNKERTKVKHYRVQLGHPQSGKNVYAGIYQQKAEAEARYSNLMESFETRNAFFQGKGKPPVPDTSENRAAFAVQKEAMQRAFEKTDRQ